VGRLEIDCRAEDGRGSIGQRKTPSLEWMDDRAWPDGHLEELGLAEARVEPEGDADLDFHDALLLSLDD